MHTLSRQGDWLIRMERLPNGWVWEVMPFPHDPVINMRVHGAAVASGLSVFRWSAWWTATKFISDQRHRMRSHR